MRLRCLFRGGHRWQTASDGAGQLVSCGRCGTLLHRRTRAADDASFLMHTDVAADFTRRETTAPRRPGSDPIPAAGLNRLYA